MLKFSGFSKSLPRYGLAAMTALAAQVAQATEVTFTGGFTSFFGPVATAPGSLAATVHTEINGVPIYATEALPCCAAAFQELGLGVSSRSLSDSGGQPVGAVEFSRVFFGGPNPNLVAFAPSATQDLSVGSTFKIGTFTITNGSWFGNSVEENIFPDTDFGFSVTTHSSNPLLDGLTFADTLRFTVTNPESPSASIIDDADSFFFVGHRELGTLSAYEQNDLHGNPTPGNTGTIGLYVRIGSLIPVRLGDATGGAFIGSSSVSPVPEPQEALLLLGGLLALFLRLNRRIARPERGGDVYWDARASGTA